MKIQPTATETKAKYQIQTWDTDTVLAAIICTERGSWLARVLANELASRGVNHEGQWIGHDEARRLWVDADDRSPLDCTGLGTRYMWQAR